MFHMYNLKLELSYHGGIDTYNLEIGLNRENEKHKYCSISALLDFYCNH